MSNESQISTAIATLFKNEMTDQGLAKLRERFPADVVHDMTDEVQFKAARKTRTERNKLVEAIKDRRIGVNGEIKTKADDLTSKVELIFSSVVDPFETQDQINKDKKKKAERELKVLLDDQRIEISGMNNFVSECIGKSSQSISEVIEAVDLIDTTYFHKEIIHEAIEAKKTICARLAELLTHAINEEALQIERDKLAKQQQQADEAKKIADLKAKAQERLNNLMMIPTGFYGKSSKEINDKIQSLDNYQVLESEFGELFDPACSAKQQVINQLSLMLDQQKKVEQAEADRKAQSDKETEGSRLAQVKEVNDQTALAIEQNESVTGQDNFEQSSKIGLAMGEVPTLLGIDPASGKDETVTATFNEEDELTKAKNLLNQVMGNYQVAASIAENEGYETNYDQDKILVDFLLNY